MAKQNIIEEIPDIAFDMTGGSLEVLIQYDRATQKFSIPEKALTEIGQYEEGVCLVSIVGERKSGKSFLLNQVMELDRAFIPDTDAVYFWTKPIVKDGDRLNVFLVDCPSIGEFGPDADSKLFALMYLISSIMLFSSKGPITSHTLDLWKHISYLTNYFTVTEEPDQNDFNMVYYSPKLIWLLRDADNLLDDNQGGKITANQYMETALAELANQQLNPEALRTRQNIVNYMKVRECLSFPSLTRGPLPAAYLEELSKLRERVYSRSSCKQMDGFHINCGMFTTYINELIENINTNQVFALYTVWDSVIEKECAIAYMEATDFHRKYLKDRFMHQEEAYSDEYLDQLVKTIRDDTMSKYTKLAYLSQIYDQVYNEYLEKLQQFIDQKETLVYEINNNIAKEKNSKILDGLLQTILSKSQAGCYRSSNLNELNKDFSDVLDAYAKSAVSASAAEVAVEKLKAVNEQIIKSLATESKAIISSAVDTNGEIDFGAIELNFERRIEEKNSKLKAMNHDREEFNSRLRRKQEENKAYHDRFTKWEETKIQYESNIKKLENETSEQEAHITQLKETKQSVQTSKKRWWQCG